MDELGRRPTTGETDLALINRVDPAEPMSCEIGEMDWVGRMGIYFVANKIQERHGITFERFLEAQERGTWAEYMRGVGA